MPSSKPSDPNSPTPSTAPQKDPEGERRADEIQAQIIANLNRARREKEAVKQAEQRKSA